MECPRCGNTKFKATHTTHVGEAIQRDRQCVDSDFSKGCGLVFRTLEYQDDVQVFNFKSTKAEWVPLSTYKTVHRDNELKGISGFQNRLFGE